MLVKAQHPSKEIQEAITRLKKFQAGELVYDGNLWQRTQAHNADEKAVLEHYLSCCVLPVVSSSPPVSNR